ncbi:MAG: PKD domain-containing protein, partial [Candidatus Bathyarchaeota archaeon]|nr:PKD domain-containing protein [Candidatus Bathyarchaeota archaeon]
MHKRKLSPPRLRVFSFVVLFLLVGVLFLGLVYAGPAPSVISQPSNYIDVNGEWINEPNAWDWNNSTYADETQLRVINNIYWSGFNATDLGPINRVDLRIVITLAGLTNDYVTLKYYVGGVEGDPWTSITSSVTQQCFSLDNATEPNDGSWSWADIGSLEIRQIGTQTKGPDPLTAYRTHEVWAVIYYGQPPVASFTYTPEYPYTGETVTFNASASYDPDGYIVSYEWDFGDGTNGTGEIATHIYANDGTYTVTLNVTDNHGLYDITSKGVTVLNRPPIASFTESAETVLTAEPIYFDASASYDPDGTIASYFWDFGDGSNATGVIVEHAYADDGTYTVTLTVTDDDEATDTTMSTKTVLNRYPIASFTESAETVYTGETITFNASDSYDPDGTITSYFWDFGDGTNATGVTVEHTYATNGTFIVTLTVTDDDGASDSASSIKTILMNETPVALFTESAETVYTGDAITFNASDSYDPDGTIVSYEWNFGDGANATGVIVEHTYMDDGVYTVTLTVTDDKDATDTTTSTKTVLNSPPVASFTESAETVYTNDAIAFNASESYDSDGNIVSYFWDFGDGTNTTGAIVEHSYVDDGNYTVTLTVTDDDGATDSTSATKTVLNRAPVASFTESAETVYTGEAITFNASDSYDPDGVIVSYFWDFSDGTNATGAIVEHTYADDGNYTVTLTVTDDDGATASTSATKTVLNSPPVAFFTESAETAYTSETITFNASGSYDSDGTIVSYFWDFGDGMNATGVVVEYAYAQDGNYTVTLTVTDNDGATNTATSTKTVLNRPPVAIFTESAETVLTGETIYFNASQSYDLDGWIVSYFWDFGDGTNATGVVVEHTYSDNGVYTVTLTVTDDDNDTATTTATKTVLNRPPVASFTESAETMYTGEIIYFSASGSYDADGTIVSYFWDFGDGSNATGVTTQHAYADDGNYTITLTVTDDDGVSSSTSATKTVLNSPPVAFFTESAETAYTSETITFNASGSYDSDGTIVSFFWDFGDGANATGIIVNHAYVDDGVYTVILTVTDNDGASASASASKTVLNRPPVAIFTESATTVLTDEVITFNASASYDPDGTIVSYFWDFGDGVNGSGVIANHSYANDGTYTVTLTVTDNDGATASTNATKTVLNRPPVAVFTESATTVLTGEVITFNASSSYDPDGAIVSYFWNFGDGTNTTNVIVSHAYTD